MWFFPYCVLYLESPLSEVLLYLVCVQVKYKYKVIIMELCTGGSLYEVIDSPENAYGLDEPQFKQLIYDVGQLLLSGLLIFLSHLDFGEYHPFPQL